MCSNCLYFVYSQTTQTDKSRSNQIKSHDVVINGAFRSAIHRLLTIQISPEEGKFVMKQIVYNNGNDKKSEKEI